MDTDVQVPKGLTLIDPSQAPSGADTSAVKIPKGLTLVGGQEEKKKPAAAAPPQKDKGVSQFISDIKGRGTFPQVPIGLTLQPKPSPFEGQSHVIPEQNVIRPYTPTVWERFKRSVASIPVEPGKTLGDVGEEIHRIASGTAEHVSNPMGMTDAEWEQNKKRQQNFIEKNLGKGVAAGAATGAAEFGEELTSPFQIALMVGTFGESALARGAAKLGINSAVPAARTLSKLIQAQFVSQMVEGAATGAEQTYKSAMDGDWEGAGKSAVESLASAVMAKGLIDHETATDRVRTDLDKVAKEKYGPSNGNPFLASMTNRFDQLDPYRQAAVIHETVQRTPEYKAVVEGVDTQDSEAKAKAEKQRAKKLAYYEQEALNQTWSQNAVTRTIRRIDEHRRSNARAEVRKTVENAHRAHYLDQITKLIDLHRQDRADEAELTAVEQERRDAAREGRPAQKTEAAKKREEARRVTLASAEQISEARQGVTSARETAEGELAEQERVAPEAEPQGVVRQPDQVTDDHGYISYRAHVFGGEERNFGVAQSADGKWGIYQKSPDGIEFLGSGGIFEGNPEQPFIAADEATAKTLAQITSLRVNADYALEEHGSTPEREAERSELRNLERKLVDGEVTGDQARKAAGLPEEKGETPPKPTVNQEIEAARAGALNGPLHGKTRAQFEDSFLEELEGAGWSPEEIDAAIDTIGPTLRMEAENNLHFVGRSGDWIASKKGATWVLDEKGMLHSDDGMSAPIPLMKNGRYSSQAIDLSMSGRVGFGQRSFEEARVESSKEREAQRQLENLVGNVADELENAIRLGKQNAGLQIEAGELPPERPAPERRRAMTRPPQEGEMISPERETEAFVMELRAERKAKKQAEDATWIEAIAGSIAENSENAWQFIERVAKNSGLSPQEVLKIQLERLNGPDTLEGKIDRLKAGDTISDSMGLPWVVRADKNGTLYLRKGDGARVHINKFNPSDDVRRIVGRGEVTKAPGPAFTPEDVRRAAYEAPYITRRQEAVERVKELAEKPPPAPKTPEQAKVQLAEAEVREVEVKDAAVEATEAAVNPTPKTTDSEINKAVAKSEELRKVAADASAQTAKAKGRSAGPGMYPQKASISAKGFPSKRGLVGFDSYVQTDAGRIPVHIELVRLDRLTTSFRWNGNELERQPDYLEAMQDVPPDERTRMDLLSDAQPGNYDADRYLDPGYGPENGPAIVDTGGDVAGGNRRLLRMLKNLELIGSDEIALSIFKDKMRLYALRNGMEYPEGDEIYIPVRMMNEPIGTVARASELGALFNKPASHGIDEDAKSITYGRLLGEAQAAETAGDSGKVGILDRIGNEFNSADTPREAMANNPKFFIQVVKDYFHIGAAESADWFGKNMSGEETLKEEGREKIEKALLATILKNPSTLADIRKNAPNAYESLLKSIGPMTRLRAIPDKDITGLVEEAVAAVAQTARKRVEGDSPKMRWNNTYTVTDMYSTEPPPQEPGPVVEALWRALHDRKTTRFKNALNDYLVGEGPQKNFFELVQDHLTTPVELFNAAFEKELKEVRDSRGVNSPEATSGKFKGESGGEKMREYLGTLPWEMTEAEFDAAREGRQLSDEAVEDAKRSEEGKGVREGKVGDMLAAGESVLTATGRETTPFPKIDTASNRKAGNTLKRADQWLMDNAIAEAKARGDDFNLRQFEANREKPSQADKDSAEMYLFDKESVQPIPRPFTKPFVAEKPGALTPPPEPPSAAPAVEVGQRVTFTPNNFNHNDVVGVVRDVITNTSGAKGYQIVDDAGIEHRVWERDGTIGSETKAVDQKAINSLNDEERKLRKRQATLEAEVKKPSGVVPPAISSELNSKRGVELNDIRKRLDAIVDERRKLMQGGDGETNLAAAKAEKGFVTPDELQKFIESHPSTAAHAPEVMRTARMMAEYVYDLDPPEGIERKDALAWVLQERLAGLENSEDTKKAGSYRTAAGEERFGKGILALHKAADETTFIHEFAHLVFPLLSEEDMRAINTLEGKKGTNNKPEFPQWDGKRGSLTGEVFNGVSEKFAGGLGKFLRDENPTGFTSEVKMVLAKIKKMFTEFYKTVKGDPLSPFTLTEEAKGVFADMFHVTDFDVADDFKKDRDKARREEAKQKKGMVKPDEVKHPLQQIATEFGAKGIQESMDGPIEDTFGDRVDPNGNTVVLVYPNIEEAVHGISMIGEPGSKIQDAEVIAGADGSYGIRFNVDKPVPKNILFQDVPKRHPALEMEDTQKRLDALPADKVFLRKVLETRIAQLKAEIRSKYGIESPKFGLDAETAKKAVAEVKSGTAGRTNDTGGERVSDLRRVPDGSLEHGQKGTGRLSRPPIMGMPGHAGAGGAADRTGPGRGNAQPVNLANVTPVKLNPLPERGTPVGILAGEAFDEKAWREGNKRAGLPENMPAPTVTLSPEVARVLKYGGQKQIAQTILSALEHGDGAVIASATGSGKSFTAGAVIKETLLKNPDAKILLITKNRRLLKTAAQIGKDNFGYEMEVESPEGALDKNVYGASYQRLINNPIYSQTQWDLVISDESGEARNWHLDVNQQGKLLKAVMDNAKKGVYVSATPFHSPMEYGYLDKLNLWPKGGFENWIKENFAHEKVGDKIIAKLDPAKQAKMRQQLIERGQMVSQEISYDGFTTHFGVVPVTDVIERKLDRIHQGIAVARRELLKQGKKGLSERIAAFEATYTKAFLERSRLPEAIQLAKRARAAGWQVIFFSETTSEDLFRRPVGPKEEPGTYRLLDEETGGQVSRIMPEFPNIMDELRSEFGDEIGDYSGSGNTDAQREESKDAFLKGKKPLLYTSYAAGGIGVSLHDEEGNKPRVSIFLGPPYSGVLLEQSLGRTWRFGVKSNAMAVFLATDSEPDIRLMATKVGPRMRALRASVLGERDSLASVMANYTDEEKMREHQDMMAYSEQGNEVKVDAQGFQVRSKRKVNFDNWSSIQFPNAEEAMNKGMQVEMSGGGKGSDWATLYQEKPKRWEPPNRPLTIEDIRIRRAVNAAADKAAASPQVPASEIGMAAARAEEVAKAAPEGVDKEAAARDAVGGHLKGIGYVQDPLTGEWKTPEQIEPAKPVREPEEKYRAGLGITSSQEQNLIYMDRKMKTGGAGRELVTKTRRYTALIQRELADRRMDFTRIMQENHLNPKDDKVMRDIFDVVMGKRAVSDPAINKAAGQVSGMMAKIHQKGAEGNLAVRTPDGRMIPWSAFQDDASYMPRIPDWDATFSDGEKTYTLKEIMGGTFGEIKAKELIAKKLKEEGHSMTADRAYQLIRRDRIKAPVQGNIQKTNETNFPFIKKDYEALDSYFKQFSKAMATESEFGSDLRKLQKEIAKIPNKQARSDVENMFGYMFTPQNWNTDLGQVYNSLAAMETATKMTYSATKVLFHAANAPLVMGGRVMPIVKGLMHTIGSPKESMHNAYTLGTIMQGVNPEVMYMPDTRVQHALFKYTGFEKLYNIGRAIAGESARVYLDQYAMHDLKKGGNTEIETRRLLKNTFLIGDNAIDEAKQRGSWTPEDYKLAQVAFTNESLYSDNPLQMPGLARRRVSGEGMDTSQKRINMALRASYSLQSFHMKTYSMLREHLWDEVMVYHNYKPLAYAMLVAPVIGQMLQATGAGVKAGVHRTGEKLRGKEHTEDSWDKWLAQFDDLKGNNKAAAFLKIYLDGICSQWALEREKRITDALMNAYLGHNKQVAATGRYGWDDEIEETLGPIWTDATRPIRFGYEEIEALGGKTGTFGKRTLRNVVRQAEETIPFLRGMPDVEEMSKAKKSTKWAVP